MKKNKIFVACDTTKLTEVKKIIRYTKTKKLKVGYKFGLEFINSKIGRKFISTVKNQTIFFDLKIHDIPNTCMSTIKAIKDLKVNYVTIHIGSGLEALKAVKKTAGKIRIVGVTILTSLNNKSLKSIGYSKRIKDIVMKQITLAKIAKLDAIVVSPHEVKIVRKLFKKEIITPGIRFANKRDDQKRVMTPKDAFTAGSDWLVIGRPITKGNIKNNIKKLINHLK